MNELTLAFAVPEHGWLVVTLGRRGPGGAAPEERRVDASDVPCDSLDQLAVAMCRLLDGAAEAEMEWSLEPAYEVWRFRVEPGAGADEAPVHVDVGVPPAKLHTFAVVPRRALALLVWRALRRLQQEPAWQSPGASDLWSWPFPAGPVRALGAKLGR
jgi:hypothetical protein